MATLERGPLVRVVVVLGRVMPCRDGGKTTVTLEHVHLVIRETLVRCHILPLQK